MAQSFIQVPPDSSGKKVDTWVTTTAAQHRETAVIGDPSVDANVLPVKAASTAAVAADCAIPVCLSPNNAPIISVGAGAFHTSTTSVTGVSGSPTSIVSARTGVPGTGRVAVTIGNTSGSITVTITESASGTTGWPLLPGAGLTINGTAQVYGFVASGSATVAFLETF